MSRAEAEERVVLLVVESGERDPIGLDEAARTSAAREVTP